MTRYRNQTLTTALLASIGIAAVGHAVTPGAADPTFDDDGRTYVFFDQAGLWRDAAADALVEPDGAVVLVGRVETGGEGSYDWGISRLLPNGELDVFWGDAGGKTTIHVNGPDESAQAIVSDGNGGYIVAGWTGGPGGTDFLVIRLDGNGQRDVTWGADGGKVLADFSTGDPGRPFDRATALALLPGNRILVAGTGAGSDAAGTGGETALLRLLPGGARDPDFGGVGFGGVGQCRRDWYAFGMDGFMLQDLAVEAVSGKIVVAGFLRDDTLPDFAFAIQRMTSLCDPDSTFANSLGQIAVSFEPGNAPDLAYGVAIQPDGKVVVAGRSYVASTGNDDFAILRLTHLGALDTSFGGNGGVRIPFDLGGDSMDVAWDLALQGDGRILLGGRIDTASEGRNFAVARLNPDGSPDSSFGLFGRAWLNFAGGGPNDESAAALVLAPDGRIVLAGEATRSLSGDLDFAIARLQNDYIFADLFESGSTATWSASTP